MHRIPVVLVFALALAPGPSSAQHVAGPAVRPVTGNPGSGRVAPHGRLGFFFRHRSRRFFQPFGWWGTGGWWGTADADLPYPADVPPPQPEGAPVVELPTPAHLPNVETFTCVDAARIVSDAGPHNASSNERTLSRVFRDPGGVEALANALRTAGYPNVLLLGVEPSGDGMRATYLLGPRDAPLC